MPVLPPFKITPLRKKALKGGLSIYIYFYYTHIS